MSSNMNPKPLTYPALKCVLQHMEANLRIQLAQKLPSIRTAEKAAPLRIEYLFIKPYEVEINKTTYKLGVIRTCEMDWLVKPFLHWNEKGGQDCDVDEYGMPDRASSNVVLPGDVVIGDLQPAQQNQPNYEETLRMMLIRKGVIRPEENEVIPDIPRFGADAVEDEDDQFGDVIDPRADTLDRRYEDYLANQRSHLATMNYYQANVFQNRLREENAPPPFTNYLQLTMKNSVNSEENKKERLVYKKKIHEAMKYLMNKTFGGRPVVINVNFFRVRPATGILRVPENFQLRVQSLETGCKTQSVLNSISSFVSESSFPLKSLTIDAISLQPEDLQPSTVKNAKELIVLCLSLQNQITTIIQLRNRQIHWTSLMLQNQVIINFINNWIINPRGVGTLFTFNMYVERLSEELFTLIKELPNAKVIEKDALGYESFPHPINIPIGETSHLNVSVDIQQEEQYDCWRLKFREVETHSLDSD